MMIVENICVRVTRLIPAAREPVLFCGYRNAFRRTQQ
jgi:hypothetical protein